MASAEPTDYAAKYANVSMQQLAAGGGGIGSTFGENSAVWMPHMGVLPKGSPYILKPTTGPQIKGQIAAGDVMGLPLQWMNSDPNKLRDFVNKGVLNKVPGFDVGMGMPEILDAWQNLLKRSWQMNQVAGNDPNRAWSPYDVMDSYGNSGNKFGTVRKGDWEYDIATGEKVKYVGPRSKTQTAKNVNLSSPEDVKAIATEALSALLGRAPNAEEMAKFRSSIAGLEQANPEVQTTTQTLNDMGEVVSTSSQTSGGVSAAARAAAISEETKKTKEYGEFQSNTTYANALMQMIGGGG